LRFVADAAVPPKEHATATTSARIRVVIISLLGHADESHGRAADFWLWRNAEVYESAPHFRSSDQTRQISALVQNLEIDP
jgi:hypothetical protein